MTNEAYERFVLSVLNPNVSHADLPLWVSLGLNAEAGEAGAEVEKAMRKGRELDVVRFRDELADVLWFVTCGALSTGSDLAGLMKINMEKLSARKEKEPERLGLAQADQDGSKKYVGNLRAV